MHPYTFFQSKLFILYSLCECLCLNFSATDADYIHYKMGKLFPGIDSDTSEIYKGSYIIQLVIQGGASHVMTSFLVSTAASKIYDK